MDNTRPTLLVTGASGFIGRHLVRALAERFPGARILTPVGRLADAAAELDSFAAALDGVFHLAAHTPKAAEPEDDVSVRATIESNVFGLQSLLDAVDGRSDRLVFASTLDVYRPPAEGVLLDEASPLGPATVYGASKVMGESMVRAWARRHGARFAILRFAHVYGPGEDRYRKLIPVAIESALAGGPVLVSGDGSALRDYVYVADVADALVAAWRRLESGSIEAVNVASGQSVSVHEVARAVCEATPGHAEIAIDEPARPAGHSYRFDTRRLRDVLGVSPATPLREGLRAEVEWFRSRSHG